MGLIGCADGCDVHWHVGFLQFSVLVDAVRHLCGDSIDGCTAGVRFDGSRAPHIHQTTLFGLAKYRPSKVGEIVNQEILGVRHRQTGTTALALWFETLRPENRGIVDLVEVQSCDEGLHKTLGTPYERAKCGFAPCLARSLWKAMSEPLVMA